MSEQSFFNVLIIGWLVLAAVVFISLFFFVAPYGRHSRSGSPPCARPRLIGPHTVGQGLVCPWARRSDGLDGRRRAR